MTSGIPNPNRAKRQGPWLKRLVASTVCELTECNPLEILARYAIADVVWLKRCTRSELRKDPTLPGKLIPDEIRVRCAAELAQYVAPKRKAIELSGNVNVAGGVMVVPTAVTAEQWAQLAAETPTLALPMARAVEQDNPTE